MAMAAFLNRALARQMLRTKYSVQKNHNQSSPMSTPPDFKLLRIFVCVARHQGFAKAQQELNLTTSAISTYMGQLETRLGFKLCERGRGGFSLT
jgi:hypothetical protein